MWLQVLTMQRTKMVSQCKLNKFIQKLLLREDPVLPQDPYLLP